jgi:hypothetical protein
VECQSVAYALCLVNAPFVIVHYACAINALKETNDLTLIIGFHSV